jgi:hypothetical protein
MDYALNNGEIHSPGIFLIKEDPMKEKLFAKPVYMVLLGMLLLSLAACSGSSKPQLIASYPSKADTKSQPVAQEQFVYDAFMEMEAWDPEAAAERAEERADDYGGYLVSSQSWAQDRQSHIQLVLAVPAPNYEALHQVILDLGTLQNERVSGQWVNSRYGSDWSVYSEITVTFHPRSAVRPVISTTGWNPVRTLERAWSVFVTIFGFLLDILIWVVVLVGPFILMGLGLRAVIRKLRPVR